jgi:hypothetical protein
MEKQIDWYSALGMTAIYVGALNVLFFIIWYLYDGEFTGWDTHILFSTIMIISGVMRGILIPYKGFLDKEDDDDDNYYKPPKMVGYVWDGLMFTLIVYVFFIM